MSKRKHKSKKSDGPTVRRELRAEAFTDESAIKPTWYRTFSWPIVIVLCIITFFMLVHGSNYERRKGFLTFDESIYMRLGFFLKQGEPYSTVKIYEEKKRSRALPEYLNRPVFKHPPMYSWTISMFYSMLEQKSTYKYEELYAAASKVSNLAGVMLILLVFWFAKTYYGYSTGFLVAFLMAIDLNMTLSSQKVWMASSLTMWMFATLIFLYKACEEHRGYFLAAGFTFGLAMLTKYTAVLVVPILITYLLIYHRDMFKRWEFYSFFAVAGLMFLPWAIHNMKVYGMDAFTMMIIRQTAGPEKMARFAVLAAVVLAGVIGGIWFQRRRVSSGSVDEKSAAEFDSTVWRKGVVAAVGCFIAFLLLQKPFLTSILATLSWESIPNAGWDMAIFKKEPWYFYLKQHVEYSPMYLFVFLALLRAPLGKRQDVFLFTSCCWILAFTIVWGNFQGRYALSFVPPALILIASTITLIYKMLLRYRNNAGYIGLGVLSVMLFYFVLKAFKVYSAIALNHNVAYF